MTDPTYDLAELHAHAEEGNKEIYDPRIYRTDEIVIYLLEKML